MNNLDSSASTDLQDGNPIYNQNLGQSIEDNSSEDHQSPKLLCLKPGCENLQFSTQVEHRKHILTHITLPTVKVPRLELKSCELPKQESLKVRLKLTSQAGSDKPSFEDFLASLWKEKSKESADQKLDFLDELYESDFQCVEVVPSKKFLSGPGGVYCLNGTGEGVKTEFAESTFTSVKEGSSAREPAAQIELDNPNLSAAPQEAKETVQNCDQDKEYSYPDDYDPENDLEEEEEEELDDDEEEEDDEGEDGGAGSTETERGTSTAPPSPTPSEILRPRGFLAPEQLVDDDSCYPRSPPVSPTKMVEMNGSTSAVSGSDNDSGHSRSPATFTGGSGAGSGGEEDSSVQERFHWDALIGESTGHGSDEPDASNENGRSDGSSSGEADNRTSNLDVRNVVSNILENDPLMLPDNSGSAEGEQENLNLLQNLTADPLHAEGDRGAGGDTEYMSLDRLGEAPFCCDVCGEHAQDRRVLEEHRVMAGHYKCLIMPECGSIVWGTASELAAHQSSIHGVNQSQRSPQQRSTPPQTSPRGSSATPPVQQLAQQVQRLPIPQQAGFQSMPGGQYPQQQQMPPMGQMMSQMGPLPGQMPQRRPMAYRMPMPGQAPYGPGSANQQQAGFSGAIQPRPLNTLVAQQPRGQGPNRLSPGAGIPPRGMVPMPARGQKRPGPGPQAGGRGMMPPSAKQRRGEGMLPPQQDNGPGKKSDAKAVANILATRGITVTPAGGGRGGPPPPAPAAPGRQPRQNMLAPAPPPPPAPAPVTTLNLNSAISIIPTTGSGNRQNNSGFAVPQVRSAGRQPAAPNIERPPRPPTVDLTGDGPIPAPGSTRLQMGPAFHRGRGRPSNVSRTTCQICDKVFPSAEMLSQHMPMHRGPGKLPFRCNLCNAQYPTNQGLQQHRQTYHKESIGMNAPLAPGEEMVIPLIDLKQPGVAARLSSLGINHCIPLSGLGNQANGYFSLPVVSIDGSRPSAAGNLRSLGASGVLSIGPIKLVPK